MNAMGQIHLGLSKRCWTVRFKNVTYKQHLLLYRFLDLNIFENRRQGWFVLFVLYQSGLNEAVQLIGIIILVQHFQNKELGPKRNKQMLGPRQDNCIIRNHSQRCVVCIWGCFTTTNSYVNADGDGDIYFQILNTAHGRGRPKLVDAEEDYNELLMRSPLAFLVQMYELRGRGSDEDDIPSIHVHCMGDPCWVAYNHVLTADKLESVVHYTDTTASGDFPCCNLWSAPTAATPRMALTDKTCPVLWVCRALLNSGWTILQLSLYVHGKRFVSRCIVLISRRVLCLAWGLLQLCKERCWTWLNFYDL